MRLKIIAATTAAKAINKAKATGKLNLVAVNKINLLRYYMEFAQEQIDLGIESYKDKYKQLVNKFESLMNSCPDVICGIREVGCTPAEFKDGYSINISNPFNPQAPIEEPVDPTPNNNLPPTIGDNSITTDNNTTTILTLAMFTTDAGYSDPENDPIDAIRIDTIYSNNLGIFYLDGIQVTDGQIITREQIESNLFTHVGGNVQTIQKDGFDFSVRDEGSQQWVN